jgi:phage shock protein PspC (stress-responsive transcriptional regulator)
MILGVSEWVATKINIDPTIVRIGFVLSALFGFGILLYLILYVVMTQENK